MEEVPIVIELVKEQISLGGRIVRAFRRIGRKITFCGKSNAGERTPVTPHATLEPQ